MKTELILPIKNDSGAPRRLFAKSQCPCLKLEKTEFLVPENGILELKFLVNAVDSGGSTTVCFLENDGEFSFSVAVQFAIVEDVSVSPKLIPVKQTDLEIEFQVSPNFHDVKIRDVSMLVDGQMTIASTNRLSDGSLKVKGKLHDNGSPQRVEDVLAIKVAFESGQSQTLSIPIVFRDRSRISPALVPLRNGSDGSKEMIFLVTGPAQNSLSDLVLLVNDKPIRISEVKIRSEKTFIVKAQIPKDFVASGSPELLELKDPVSGMSVKATIDSSNFRFSK